MHREVQEYEIVTHLGKHWRHNYTLLKVIYKMYMYIVYTFTSHLQIQSPYYIRELNVIPKLKL